MARRLPGATYRLQLTAEAGFADAAAIVPFLASLGITEVYLSPILAARRGSTHGYDVVDPSRVSPELGGEDGFALLDAACRATGIGMLVDVVPNHLAAVAENPWWTDLLRHGRRSIHARTFDVDWDVASRDGILVPVLDRAAEELLAEGAVRVRRDPEGALWIDCAGYRLPVDPRTEEFVATAGGVAAINADVGRLGELLAAQAYRPVPWREANRALNYRRFFDITDLAAVRVEDPAVFRATHARLLELTRSAAITGFRIDHIDGLRDPLGYLRRLRRAAPNRVVVVEKILGRGESLPRAWPVEGTTGYEFTAAVTGLLVDSAGLDALGTAHARWTGRRESYDQVVLAAKREVLTGLLDAEVRALTRRLARALPDHAPDSLRGALIELTAHLPVYRTYGRGTAINPEDERRIDAAARAARRFSPAEQRAALREMVPILRRERPRAAEIADRWQQLSGPATAKGVEDTALYRWGRLIACNEVGADPGHCATGVAAFHRLMRSRSRGSLNATATHDTKRGEDVRARLAVLSEVPGAFARAAARWHRMTARHRIEPGAPDAEDEWFLYQTLAGVWPPAGPPARDLATRVRGTMRKVLREAKRRSSWLEPDTAYEAAVDGFIRAALRDAAFRRDLGHFVRRIAMSGVGNSLAQTLLKATAPGIPDVYQGTELLDDSLVDPDNRRPVDHVRRARLLEQLDQAAAGDLAALLADLTSRPHDGRLKLWVLACALRFRRDHRTLFERGDYIPLRTAGPRAGHVIAFARRHRARWSVTIAPRLTASLPRRRPWTGTTVRLPPDAPGRWRGVLDRADVRVRRGALVLADALGALPVALLAPGPRA